MISPCQRRQRIVTMRDVADMSNVSEMTVSRVMRGSAQVTPETRDRVFAAARTLGYVPNRLAGSIASRSVDLVAIIVPDSCRQLSGAVVSGVTGTLSAAGLETIVGVAMGAPNDVDDVLYRLLAWRPCGVIFAGIAPGPHAATLLGHANCQVIEVLPEVSAVLGTGVGPSVRYLAEVLARAIVESDVRNPCLPVFRICDTSLHSTIVTNLKIAFGTCGVAFSAVPALPVEGTHGEGYRLSEQMLLTVTETDCLVCHDPNMLGGMLHWRCQRAANFLKVPSIAGFVVDVVPNATDPLLVSLPLVQIGRDAARLIIEESRTEFVSTRLHFAGNSYFPSKHLNTPSTRKMRTT